MEPLTATPWSAYASWQTNELSVDHAMGQCTSGTYKLAATSPASRSLPAWQDILRLSRSRQGAEQKRADIQGL